MSWKYNLNILYQTFPLNLSTYLQNLRRRMFRSLQYQTEYVQSNLQCHRIILIRYSSLSVQNLLFHKNIYLYENLILMKCVSAGRGDRQGRALRNERSEWSNGAERRNPEHSDPKRSEGERPVSCYVTLSLCW